MIDQPAPAPEPKRERVEHRKTTVAIADPSVTFVEKGPALGLLLAAHSEPDGDGHMLENVTWARCVHGDTLVRRLMRRRSMNHECFNNVRVYELEQATYVAEEQGANRFFPNPSTTPYEMRFVSVRQFEKLLDAVHEQNIESLYAMLDAPLPHRSMLAARKCETPEAALAKRFKNNLIGV